MCSELESFSRYHTTLLMLHLKYLLNITLTIMVSSLLWKKNSFKCRQKVQISSYKITKSKAQDHTLSRVAKSHKTIYIFENATNTTIPKRETRTYSTTARLHLHLWELRILRKAQHTKANPVGPEHSPHPSSLAGGKRSEWGGSGSTGWLNNQL